MLSKDHQKERKKKELKNSTHPKLEISKFNYYRQNSLYLLFVFRSIITLIISVGTVIWNEQSAPRSIYLIIIFLFMNNKMADPLSPGMTKLPHR